MHEFWIFTGYVIAWGFVIAVMSLVSWIAKPWRFVAQARQRWREERAGINGVGQSAETANGDDIYQRAEPYARRFKAITQMVIATVTVCVVGWQFLHAWPTGIHDPMTLLLDGIGVGLAAAAVVELAYTLFTAGPDEALDPLMLGLSATVLIELGRPDPLTVARAGALLLLGLLLAVLFVLRLFLAENHHSEDPRVWWIGRRRRNSARAK